MGAEVMGSTEGVKGSTEGVKGFLIEDEMEDDFSFFVFS